MHRAIGNTCTELESLFSKPSRTLAINPCRSSYHMNELLDYIPDITKQMFWPWVLLWSCGFADTVAQLVHAANQRDASLNRFYGEWIEINWRAQLRNTFRPLAYCKVCSLFKPVQGLFVPASLLGVDVWWPCALTATPSTRTLIILYQCALLYAISSLPLVSLCFLACTCISNEHNGTPGVCGSRERCVKVEGGHAVKASPWSEVDACGRLVC